MRARGVVLLIKDKTGRTPELISEISPDLPRTSFLRELGGRRHARIVVYGEKIPDGIRGYRCLEAAMFPTVFLSQFSFQLFSCESNIMSKKLLN